MAVAVHGVERWYVRYVLARSDLNIRGGPGTEYRVVGWLARGQTAAVTGIGSDGGWWRVVCPDGSSGSCWVTASTQYTQTTTTPGSTPAATSEPSACIDKATLIADVTVPDGTQFPPNSGFNKIWRIKNAASVRGTVATGSFTPAGSFWARFLLTSHCAIPSSLTRALTSCSTWSAPIHPTPIRATGSYRTRRVNSSAWVTITAPSG